MTTRILKNSAEAVDTLSSYLLDNEDFVELFTAKKLARLLPQNLFPNLSFDDLTYLLFIIVNLASITHRLLSRSVLTLRILTKSGLKKTYMMIFENPALLILFFISLYFYVLGDLDKRIVEGIAGNFNLPIYSNLDFPTKIYSFAKISENSIAKFQNTLGFKIIYPEIVIQQLSNTVTKT